MKDSKNNVTDLNLVRGIMTEEKSHMYPINKEEKMRLNEIKKGDPLTEDDILNSRAVRQSIMNNLNLGKKQPKSKESLKKEIEFLNNNINELNKLIYDIETNLNEKIQIKKDLELDLKQLSNYINNINEILSKAKGTRDSRFLLLNTIKKDLEELEGNKNE